jgi:hypothetical protein
MNLNLREYTHVSQWIPYPGILLDESYNGICTLADLFVGKHSLIQSSDWVLGVCVWVHSTEYLFQVQYTWWILLVEELVAKPIMDAVADHCGGYTLGW